MMKLPSEVYIAGWIHGSPTSRWGVYARNYITEVNGVPTPDLQVFLDQIKKIENNKFFRLTLMTTQNVQFVKTLKRDELYFPLTEYVMAGPSEWKTIRHPIETDARAQE
jgi:C-terminal processing protease CtpA/Prc